MNCGKNWNKNCPHRRPEPRAGANASRIANCWTPCSTCCGEAVRGGPSPVRTSVPGRPSMIALWNGRPRESLNGCGRAVSISMTRSRGSTGNGKQQMGPTSGHPGGGKEAGPNPTDRGKPGYKDHLLVDGRGVPVSMMATAANVNDGPMLAPLLHNPPIVRPQPPS